MRVRTRSRRAPVVVRSPLGNSNSRWSRQTRSVARKMNRATIAPDTNTIPKLWRSALTGENAPLMSSGPTTPHNRAAITQPVSDNTARKAGTITARRRRLALAGVSAKSWPGSSRSPPRQAAPDLRAPRYRDNGSRQRSAGHRPGCPATWSGTSGSTLTLGALRVLPERSLQPPVPCRSCALGRHGQTIRRGHSDCTANRAASGGGIGGWTCRPG